MRRNWLVRRGCDCDGSLLFWEHWCKLLDERIGYARVADLAGMVLHPLLAELYMTCLAAEGSPGHVSLQIIRFASWADVMVVFSCQIVLAYSAKMVHVFAGLGMNAGAEGPLGAGGLGCGAWLGAEG